MILTIADVTVNTKPDDCVYSDYAGGRCDSLEIGFLDGEGEITDLDIQKGDTVECSGGNVDTGTMYVSDITYRGKKVLIRALSMPPTCRSTANYYWDNTSFRTFAEDMADEMGLTLDLVNDPDVTYRQIVRLEHEAVTFLAGRAALEGYAVKIKDGVLKIYKEQTAETEDIEIAYQKSDFADILTCSTSDAELLSTVVNSYRTIDGQNITTSKSADVQGKVLRQNIIVSSIDESERFCSGLLRKANKGEYISVGTVEGLYRNAMECVWLTDAPGSFAGQNFIYKAMHDFVNERQTLYMRKALEDY